MLTCLFSRSMLKYHINKLGIYWVTVLCIITALYGVVSQPVGGFFHNNDCTLSCLLHGYLLKNSKRQIM